MCIDTGSKLRNGTNFGLISECFNLENDIIFAAKGEYTEMKALTLRHEGGLIQG